MTILDTVSTIVGVRCAAIPLDSCRIIRPYLLDKYAIPTSGTALFFAVPYLVAADAGDSERNISLYAVPRDYHMYIRELTEHLIPALQERWPAIPFALFSDHSPLAEVEAAARAGVGCIGKNGLLITPDYGSFVFIGEVITGATWPEVTGKKPADMPDFTPHSCMGCGACIRACPGHCLEGEDHSCLSALTQKKGALSEEEIEALSSHPLIWGCDICQTVCPCNRAVLSGGHDTPIAWFREKRIPHLSASMLSAMSDEEFGSRAFSWRGRKVLERNLSLKEQADKAADTGRQEP